MKHQNQLPSFSKDLRQTFHMNQNQAQNPQELDQDKAIYILNKIKVE